jgi:calcineurin-like phosphoesterase family protein
MSQDTFFTSDEHYGHSRIIGFANRPFDDITEMREELIRRHNDVVGPGDLVYHLGDFSFQEPEEAIKVVKRLNGNKFLVWGNHDKALRKSKEFMSQWIWCKDQAEIEVQGTKVVLNHFPMLAWNKSHHGSFHVHGHCHGTLKPDPGARRVDAGVDCFDYYPAHFEEIKAIMDKKVFVPIDQHGSRGNGH